MAGNLEIEMMEAMVASGFACKNGSMFGLVLESRNPDQDIKIKFLTNSPSRQRPLEGV